MFMLNLPPGYQAELINAGCCGMAGSFGFEKEHYDISMQIGGPVPVPRHRIQTRLGGGRHGRLLPPAG